MVLFAQLLWIDYAIMGLVGFYLIIGLTRGGRKEILSLFSWFLAIGVSWSFASDFVDLLQKVTAIEHSSVRMAAAFTSLLIITRFLTSFIFFLMNERRKKYKRSVIDHLSGMFVGTVRGLVVVAVIILLGGMTPLPNDSWWNQSKLIPPFQSSAIWLRDHFPSEMAEYIHFS